MKSLDLSPPPVRRLIHYTPLRYPGGKGKLAPFIKELLKENRLLDGEYVEPYAGGAAIAMELLFHDYVSHVHINDLSRPVFTFWDSVLNDTERLCRLVRDTPLSMDAWDRQKCTFAAADKADNLALGFATFYLNRTNRSGILNGGAIGGRNQTGAWKIDARFNREELVYRIESIAKLNKRISLTGMDAIAFLKSGMLQWPRNTLIYLDPPYYVNGRELYYDYYTHEDHQRVAEFVTTGLKSRQWIVSYDNEPPIRAMYAGCQRLAYNLGYSARDARQGAEVIFFSETMRVPSLVGPFKLIRGSAVTRRDIGHSGRKENQHRTGGATHSARLFGDEPIKPKTPTRLKPERGIKGKTSAAS